jgi:hypothetical protein
LEKQPAGIIYGTYRHCADLASVLDVLSSCGLLQAIDTAPNYGRGEAERVISALHADTPVFSKVGYGHGDPVELDDLREGRKHSLTPSYIRARINLSRRIVGDRLAGVLLHNPEESWGHPPDPRTIRTDIKAIAETLAQVIEDTGPLSFGIASWSISPFSSAGRAITSQFQELLPPNIFRFWMHPLNILRLDLIEDGVREEQTEGRPSDFPLLLASAPFAGKAALDLMGAPLADLFEGIVDPVGQSPMLARSIDATPIVGLSSMAQAQHLVHLADLPRLNRSKLEVLMAHLQ